MKKYVYAILSFGWKRKDHDGNYFTTFTRTASDTLHEALADFIIEGDETEVLEIIHSKKSWSEYALKERCSWWDKQLALRDKEQDDVQ